MADAAQRRSAAEVRDYDVPEPFGAGAEVHREVAALIDASVTSIAEAIAPAVEHSASGVRPS